MPRAWLERRRSPSARKRRERDNARSLDDGYVILLIIGVGGMAQRGAFLGAAVAAFGAGLAVSVLYPWDDESARAGRWERCPIAVRPLVIYLAVGAAAAGYLLGLFGGLIVVRILLEAPLERSGEDR